MKKWIRYFLLGLVAFVIFSLATMPATWVADQIEERIPEAKIYGVQGTLWSGDAEGLVYSDRVFRPVKWRLFALPLLMGRLQFGFTAQLEKGEFEGTLTRSLFRSSQPVLLQDFRLNLPAQEMALLFFPPDEQREIHGQIDIAFNELQVQSNGILTRADGTIFWRDAAIEQNRETIDLGTFTLQFTTTGTQVNVSLLDSGGPMITELEAGQQVDSGDLVVLGKLGYRPDAKPLIIMLLSAQLNLQGEKEKEIRLQGNIKSLAGLLEQLREPVAQR